ncbi:cold shock domain-containing protein [Streptomyces microflavus]|uniref:cold shock domain-containing protein n=1 Tax=Streptomyces microflavus TaxID=1919 RepID=UPI0036F0C531
MTGRSGPPRSEGRRYADRASEVWERGERRGGIAREEGGADVQVSYKYIDTNGFRSLEGNQQVSFDLSQSPDGPRAKHVSRGGARLPRCPVSAGRMTTGGHRRRPPCGRRQPAREPGDGAREGAVHSKVLVRCAVPGPCGPGHR